MTPLGVPVLPLEKITVARESGDFLEQRSRAGRRRARSRALNFSSLVDLARMSSIYIAPCGVSSLALERNAFEVMIVEMRHCSMAADMASRPAVKFRLTGIVPASVMARLVSAPPTDGGSRTPIISASCAADDKIVRATGWVSVSD